MLESRSDGLGQSEAVLVYFLHREKDYLKHQLLNPRWYPVDFHSCLEHPEHWHLLTELETFPLMQLHVRVSLHGRLRSFKPDMALHERQRGIIIAIEVETTCSWDTVDQAHVYGALSTHVLVAVTRRSSLLPDHVIAVQPFVLYFRAPSDIEGIMDRLHFKLVDLLDGASHGFLEFPPETPLGCLQALLNHDDVEMLHEIAQRSDLDALNKLFIIQNAYVHGSDEMKAAVRELERKGLLDLESLEKEAARELPPRYMRYFTPEQLRGLTPEQLRGLTPEQLRGLTPEQLRGLTPEQQVVVLEQLARDSRVLREVLEKMPKSTRRKLISILQEIDEDANED